MKCSTLAFALFLGLAMPTAALAQDGGAAVSAGSTAAAGATASAGSTGAAVSTPAATSTSTESSAASGSTAGAAGSVSDASAPSAGLTPNAGESDASFLARVMTAREGEVTTETGEQAQEPQEQEQPKPGEETGTEETADAEGEDEDGFDPYAPAGAAILPKDLTDKLNANPAFKAALDADPALKQSLVENSRLAAETDAFRKVFPNAQQAEVAAQGNREFVELSNLVTAIQKPEDAQGFYQKLLQLSVIKDDEGNPVLQNGKPVTDDTVGRLIHHTAALFLNHWQGVAGNEQNPDEELQAAVDILRDRAFSDKAKAGGSDLTAEQKQRQDTLDAREKALNEQGEQARAASDKAYEDTIQTGIDGYLDKEMTGLLARTDLSEKDRTEADAKIRKAAYDLIADNPQFQRELAELQRRKSGPKTQQERIGLGKRWLQTTLPLVAPQIIADAGSKILAKQTKHQQRQTAREDGSRSETQGSLRTARPVSNTNSAADVTKTAIANLTEKLGRSPDSSEMISEIIRLRSGQAAV